MIRGIKSNVPSSSPTTLPRSWLGATAKEYSTKPYCSTQEQGQDQAGRHYRFLKVAPPLYDKQSIQKEESNPEILHHTISDEMMSTESSLEGYKSSRRQIAEPFIFVWPSTFVFRLWKSRSSRFDPSGVRNNLIRHPGFPDWAGRFGPRLQH